ncbi:MULTISPECIES: HAD family hydrolase [Halomicrobium]|uniref:HAD-superfamily hydrolase, subfamily IA, variant 1 n=2 Tax=Halomicrobium mukohataei TaxID=57705 RepID=C7P1P1_HALMD|nr:MULTISPECIES: HAD family hydrolase [Halomicrobium]ACV49131.1 HAD-superfamily hydrolase, subfamily IA, variant 1 [Halomicrobium mukohataei DSM 12286]MBO4246824.1 HAD family hydrolase [Halomicrobium sp. IBSBa]NLV11328.1 HAD-IA family hydrolase [Halomicrobium mukohataei]QCD64543.1 HAD family hydrolase [Halomicrobium mukohataei]QFR19349.1 HAD-IA family hydrolase [Halomicrobium sp. ZPS1]
MTYDTVVFDNDGVLVGRTAFDVLQDATQETFEAFGVTDPDPNHVENMTVGATPHQVATICGQYDLPREEFWRAREEKMVEAQQEEARAGRKRPYDDIDTLDGLDAAKGIVSSNQQATVDFLLDHFSVRDHFGTAYGREPTIQSLDRRKPNSHYLDRALADLDADSALFVGDNESDIRAAENAGIDSAFIRRPHRTDWELNVWPTWDIDSLSDLHDICRT